MSAIVPFRALRPWPDAASYVAAVPYDVVNTEEAQALAADNPLSFLHVSRAEIDLPPGTDPYADIVYARATENLAALKTKAPLVFEDNPSLYVYRSRMGKHVQTGVAGGFSIDEYDAGIIKKHERTRSDKENDRTRHIMALRAQTGPVFLTYRGSGAVDVLVQTATTGSPLFDFTASDGVRHTIWRVAPSDQRSLVAAFEAVPALYIADGHHRAASAARVRQQLRSSDQARGEWDTFLAVAFPDNQIQVLAYNRVIRDLVGETPDSLMAALQRRVTVKAGPAAPTRQGNVAMFLSDRWHTIDLGTPPGRLAPGDCLDTSRLHDLILAPLLGIGDVRTDGRIDFVGGVRGTEELEKLVTSGKAAIAFSMYPVGVDDLMAIADVGGIMPPKSTWFEPKLRDGLLSHVL